MLRVSFISLALILGALTIAGSCSKPPGQSEFDRGLYELRRGNNVRAKALLEKSISTRPGSEENALAYNYLGLAAWRLGQYQAAQEAFEDSRRLSPNLMEPVYNLGVLLAASGDTARAAKLFEEAARMDERDTRALEYLARLYTARQQWPEARRLLYAALERQPGSPRIRTAIAAVDLKSDGPQRAVELLAKVLDDHGRYAPALFNMARIYDEALQDRAHARSYYKRFLAVAPPGREADHARAAIERLDAPAQEPPRADPPAAPPPGAAAPSSASPAPAAPPPAPARAPATPDDVLKQAEAKADRGDLAGALDLCLGEAARAARERREADQEKALRAATRICFDEPRSHYELGAFLLAQGKAEAALKSFKQAVMLDRGFAPAHLGVARAALQTGESDAALVGYQEAIKADPRSADAAWELAQLLDKNLELKEKAADAYREFERKFPSDPRSLPAAERARALAQAARASAPPPVARAPEPIAPATAPPVQRPATAAPSAAAPRQAPASTAAPAPRPPQAVVAPKPARQLTYQKPATPNTAAAVIAFNQGAQYQQQGNWDRAIFYYTRAIENDDRLTSAFYNLGIAYATKGDTDLAKDAYLRALEIMPDLVSARYNLALLYYQARDLSSATRLLQEVVRSRPDYAAAHYSLGLVYAERPDTLPQAREAYSRFLQLAPNDPSAAVVRQWLATH